MENSTLLNEGEQMRLKSEIILEAWNEGSETNKKKLEKYRLLIETFAYICMEKLEKE